MAPNHVITPKNMKAYASGYTVPMDTHWREDNPYVADWMPGGVRYEEKDSEHGRLNAAMLSAFRAAEYYAQIPFLALHPEMGGKPPFWELWVALTDQPEMLGNVVPIKYNDVLADRLDERVLDILFTLSPCIGLTEQDRKSVKEKLEGWRAKERANREESRQEEFVERSMTAMTAHPNNPDRREWEKDHGNVPSASVAVNIEKPASKRGRKKAKGSDDAE